MLLLKRHVGSAILIGEDIKIVVTSIDRHFVRLGITAPAGVAILRDDAVKKEPR